MSIKAKVTNEKKNLNRLAGEFLVASRLTQRGYMVALQWGTTIGYDILVFDKSEHVAYIEVKATASHERKWLLQAKYADPSDDPIREARRFVCCVDLTPVGRQPDIYVFPASVLASGLRYYYGGDPQRISDSPSYVLPLDSRPRYHTDDESFDTVGHHLNCEKYLEGFDGLGVTAITA
jgi:hypothetical protein